MTEKRPIVLIAFVAGILLLAGNMFVQSRLDNSIRENKLIDEQFVEGAPPMVAFTTVALGGFRGLIADFLWLLRDFHCRSRANILKWSSLPHGS